MLVIGLTGGIGSGKSAVTDHFARLGVPVIDADVVSRQVVEPGQPALQEIVEQFGAELLQEDGTLDRRRLRQHIFADPEAKTRLEKILHPKIRAAMRQQLEETRAPYAILSIPLLFETGQDKTVDRILVVDCPPEVQLRRVMMRDGSSEDEARSIIDSQSGRSQRLTAADDIIRNDGTLVELEAKVEQLHQKYLKLSS
ncbi:MAG: dephospho-CoA kinase [Sedimenticola sp.]|nr:dephospho-CoA kinase [Sedimenticola sp.]